MDMTGTSTVSLITCKAVPARAQSFVEAGVSSKLIAGICVLFEPIQCHWRCMVLVILNDY